MAGSGKTTFMQRINSYLHSKGEPPYVVNLDPAVRSVPFESNIDIRDSINYKEVMAQYNLGPNGGILTSLNLFSTKIDQIMNILEKRTGLKPDETGASQSQKTKIKNIIVDTPGQIEAFVWSASGQILLSSLASSFPTVLAYVVDTPRTASTSTFMSNMLYACSILYKTKLPMILVFNKTDAHSAQFAKDWMTDFEAFQAALQKEEETGTHGGTEAGGAGLGPVGGSGYITSLLRSMSMVLEEFYKHLSLVAVSSLTGDGIDEFFTAVKAKAEEFERDYRPELARRQKERESEKHETRQRELNKLMKDMNVENGEATSGPRREKEEAETISDLEDEDEDDDEDMDGNEDESLSERYQKALANHSTGPMSGEDQSFVRYMARSQGM